MPDDPRDVAADYLANGRRAEPSDSRTTKHTWTAADRASYVESAIQQAIREGAFDNLPGAGKPIEGLGDHHDPDWWIRRKIATEDIRGLGPVALTLRVEDRELQDRLDTLSREDAVREVLTDFNARVRQARLQLLGGPPVVTALRDVEDEVRAWQERRQVAPQAAPAQKPRRRWGSRHN